MQLCLAENTVSIRCQAMQHFQFASCSLSLIVRSCFRKVCTILRDNCKCYHFCMLQLSLIVLSFVCLHYHIWCAKDEYICNLLLMLITNTWRWFEWKTLLISMFFLFFHLFANCLSKKIMLFFINASQAYVNVYFCKSSESFWQ